MDNYRVRLSRHVSRVVELRQDTEVFIRAPDAKTARQAAWALIHSDDDAIAGADWRDDDASRQASNDEIERHSTRPEYTPEKCNPALKALSAVDILKLDPSEYA
jgi:hypothetical protein